MSAAAARCRGQCRQRRAMHGIPGTGSGNSRSGKQPGLALPKENRRTWSISSVPVCFSGLTGIIFLYFKYRQGQTRLLRTLLHCLPIFSRSVTPAAVTGVPRGGQAAGSPAPLCLRCQALLPGLAGRSVGVAALPIVIALLLSFINPSFPSFLMAL